MSKLVSIVTPSYNQGQFIKTTLDSVLKQDYPHIEHLVMDGGSTDSTLDVLQNYDDPRLTWHSERDKGQSDAINKGMRQVKGEILAYLNSDDVLLPGTISKVIGCFEQNPDVDLIYGSCYTIDANGDRVLHSDKIKVNYIVKPITLTDMMTMRIILPQQGIFWRRRVMENIGLFDESLHYRMDFDYWMRAMIAGHKFMPITEYLAAFRVHDTSKSTSQEIKFWKDWYSILDKVYTSDNLPQEVIDLKSTAYTFASYHAGDYLLRNNHYEEAREHLHQFITDKNAPTRTRVFAGGMYLDSLLKMHLFTPIIKGAYRRMRGITD